MTVTKRSNQEYCFVAASTPVTDAMIQVSTNDANATRNEFQMSGAMTSVTGRL